jgi:hypothetical protein
VLRAPGPLSAAALAAAASLVAITALRAASGPSQGAPQSLATPEHKLLEKYVGAWDAEVTMTWRQADVWKDDDTREWTMYRKGADGKEQVELQITYKRHK